MVKHIIFIEMKKKKWSNVQTAKYKVANVSAGKTLGYKGYIPEVRFFFVFLQKEPQLTFG
jgi:hypothetical protein